MARAGSQHEKILTEYILELEREGYKVIRLQEKSPDAIAVRCTCKEPHCATPYNSQYIEVNAVEVLGKTYRPKRGWTGSWTYRAKQQIYSMFDKVLIKSFKREKKPVVIDPWKLPPLEPEE